MSRPKSIADADIQKRLDEGQDGALSGWTLTEGKLHRDFRFDNFIEAFGFMTQVALMAEKMGHHPEWSNVYSQVAVDLTTHDAGGVTDLDFQLAEFMNQASTTK